jgi:hypothetical protein
MNTLVSALLATLTLIAADAETATTRPQAELPEEVVWRHADGLTTFVVTLRRMTPEGVERNTPVHWEYVLRTYYGDEDRTLGVAQWSYPRRQETSGDTRWKLAPHAAARFDTPQPNDPRATTVVFL